MISVRLDVKSAYQVQWPKKTADILQLGQRYTSYEGGLPGSAQVAAPPLAQVQAAYAAAQVAQTAAGGGEMTRAAGAETYRQTLAVAKQRLETALVRLKSQYLANLAQLEQWGLDTVISSRGVSVRKPKNDRDWAAFLGAYVAQETSLAVADQMSDPPLAEMTTLRDTLQTADLARTAGRNQREANVQTRTAETQGLLDLLQVAGLVLVVTQFNGLVTNDLQAWGFQVVAATPSPAPPAG